MLCSILYNYITIHFLTKQEEKVSLFHSFCFLSSKEVTSHATCRTSHVVWSVISCCPVTLTTAKEYAIVESAKQKVTVSSLAFTPDLSVGTLVMHHATLAPPAHTPPALQRYNPLPSSAHNVLLSFSVNIYEFWEPSQ